MSPPIAAEAGRRGAHDARPRPTPHVPCPVRRAARRSRGGTTARLVTSVAAGALAVLAVTAAVVVTSPGAPGAPAAAFAGDAKIAETLFKSGKQAYQKGDWEGSIAYFRKAAEENPALVEATWWQASAEEKRGDKAAALAGYREYLSLVGAKPSPSREELRLRGLAEKSVEALAGGEKELRKAEDAVVAALLQFAKDNFVRDPGVSLKALGHLLALRPDHADAGKLREKLGGAPADASAAADSSEPGAATGPFRDVKKWKDLLGDRTLEAKSITYEDGRMVVETKGGLLIRNESPLDFGTSYAYEMEFKVTSVYERGWLTGLLFASSGDRFLSAHVKEGRIELLRSRGEKDKEDVAGYDMPPLDTAKWHRFGIVIDGPAIDAWFDGKKVLTWSDPDGKDLEGEIGIFQQRCRTERRLFRAGKAN